MVVHVPGQNLAWPALVGECNHFSFPLRKLLVYTGVRSMIWIIAYYMENKFRTFGD